MNSSESYFVRNSLRQNIANARGKYSSLFMSGELNKENPFMKRDLEESLKMGGYEVNIRKQARSRTDMHKPITEISEFWLG